MEGLCQSVMLASLCPPQACKRIDSPVCNTMTITNCIDCQNTFDSSTQICKVCKPGFFLKKDTNQCSACMEGCLECKDEKICTRCSREDYSLEIFKKICYKGIKKFFNYGNSQTSACLSWGIIDKYDGEYDLETTGTGNLSFCLRCEPGFYPSMKSGGCLMCNCIGCHELDGTNRYNYTEYLDKEQYSIAGFPGANDFFQALIYPYVYDIDVKCENCQHLYQALVYGICIDCKKDCLRCEIIRYSPVCTKYPESFKIPFEPLLLNPKYLVRNYITSPTMFYLFSSLFYQSISYLKDNSIPESIFRSLEKYIENNKYFNTDSKKGEPCPYGCSTCESINIFPAKNYLDQYKTNCTGCRPGFYMDKIGDIIICRFCSDLDSCTTELRLKFLFHCEGGDYYHKEGYIVVYSLGDLREELKLLNTSINALKNMHHEAYLEKLEIELLFPTHLNKYCSYWDSNSPLEFSVILSDFSHVLKAENTFLRFGSYEIFDETVKISNSLRGTIQINCKQPWNFFQFYNIKIENLDFEFDKSDYIMMEFNFNSRFSFKMENVSFITYNSNYFIFKIEQAQEIEIQNVELKYRGINEIHNEIILFNLPDARSISIADFKIINCTFFKSVIFSAGKYASIITLDALEISGSYLKDFIFLRTNLLDQSEYPVTFKNTNIYKTFCIGCSVLFLRGFSNVVITDFKLSSSEMKILFNSISMNGLLVFNIIPNITNVEIKENTFLSYQFFIKNQEYEVQRGTSSILLDWKVSKNKLSPINSTFSGAFLMNFIPLESLKKKNNLLIENINMDSNTMFNYSYNEDIVIPFISIKELANFSVRNIKIYLSDDYYLGIWKMQGVSMISFVNCTIEHKESPRLDNICRYHLKENLFYIVDSDSILLTKLEIMRLSFFESAIKIVKTSDYVSLIDELFINNSNFMYNLIIVQEFTNSGLIKLEANSLSASLVFFNQVKFQENFINRENVFYTKSASCMFFDGLKSRLVIESSEFLSNTANNIYINTYSAEIINTRFENMSNQNGRVEYVNPTSLILGGYIEVSTTNFTVVQSVFARGWAYSGGAIYLTSLVNSIEISISNTKFEKLYALARGGALFMNVESSEACKMNLKNLIIKETFTNEQGGFLQIQAKQKQKTSTLNFSNVTTDGTVANIKGSFLSSSMLILSFKDCSWVYKDASNNIYELKERIKKEFLENIDLESQFTLENIKRASLIDIEETILYATSSNVENIDYTQSQDAIFLKAINSKIILNLVKIFNNLFGERGIIDSSLSELSISSTEFSNMNYSKSNGVKSPFPFRCTNCIGVNLINIKVYYVLCDFCNGGFLFVSNCENGVYINNSSFTNLKGSQRGGVLHSINCKVNFTRSNFKDVHSKLSGGVIYLEENVLTLNYCNIETSSSGIFSEKGIPFIEDIIVSGYGGAIFGKQCNISIAKSTFKDIQSSDSGGTLFYQGSATEKHLSIIETSFITTKTNIKGGALYLENAEVNITETSFKSSSKLNPAMQSLLYGGFIYSESCNLIIDKSKFSDSISDYGGMIMAVGIREKILSLVIKSCEMSRGKANFSGGGINIQNTNAFFVNSTFKEFYSRLEGGVIYGEGFAENASLYSLEIENCLFESANACQGGGLKVKYFNLTVKSSLFTLLKAELIKNIARRFLSSFNEYRFLQEVTIKSDGGGIFAFKSIIDIFNATFTYCSSTNGGAIYLSNLLEQSTNISFCKFFFNKVDNNGGALNFEEVWRVIILDSHFLENKAGQEGGGIYFISEKSSSNKFILERVIFEKNDAQIGGGMKYSNPSQDYEENGTVFIRNKAWNFGPDITSRPKSMKLAVRNYTEGGNFTLNNKTNSSYFYSDEYLIEAFRSGAEINCSMSIYLLDEKGETMTELERPEQYSASINIFGQEGSINSSNGSLHYSIVSSLSTQALTVRLINNTFVFENLKLLGVPESTAIITIKSEQIRVDDGEQQAKMYEFKIRANFRECQKGEYKNPLGTCDLCQIGYYSLFINEICKRCPENVKFCERNIFHLEPGFWRKSPESDLVIPCNPKQNCLGGIGTGDELCNNGTIGALCGSCDIYSKHWSVPYTLNGESCIQCENKELNIVVLVLFSLMQVFLTFTSIQGVLKMCNNETAFRILRKFNSGGGQNLFIYQNNYTSVYIKIFMNYITIFGFIGSFKIEIDTSIFETAEGAGNPTKRFLYALDCHIIALVELFKKFHIIYVKMIILSLMPVVLFIVFIFVYLIFYKLKLVQVEYKKIIYTALVFIVIYLQPSILLYIFKVLSCTKIGDQVYIQADLSMECFTTEHIIYGITIGVSLAVFWGIIIPFIFIRKLWLIRKQLDLPKYIMKYGFIYSEYKTNKFFWEFIKIYQKFLMIGFLNFFESDVIIKGLLVLLVLSVYYYLLVKINPYKFTKLYIIDIISCGVCFLSILFALLCHQNPYRPFVYFNISVIATINIIFSAHCLLEIFNLYLFDIKQKLESFQIFVATKIPFLAKCCVFKIKKLKSLRNWERLKLAIHNYLRALEMSKGNKPEIKELNSRAIEMMKLTSKNKYSNSDNNLPVSNVYQFHDEKTLFIPELGQTNTMVNQNHLSVDVNSKAELKIE